MRISDKLILTNSMLTEINIKKLRLISVNLVRLIINIYFKYLYLFKLMW